LLSIVHYSFISPSFLFSFPPVTHFFSYCISVFSSSFYIFSFPLSFFLLTHSFQLEYIVPLFFKRVQNLLFYFKSEN
jgi:hypothetical protein